ncbi:DUF3566 domain-containing protein [Janibacter sp. GXQ6167]|uniref:DUF3566 domain-containing protein n=1 Tax=Janibacter sp. GXQ6167 TaxID=3240791 RepID=UPI003525C6F5
MSTTRETPRVDEAKGSAVTDYDEVPPPPSTESDRARDADRTSQTAAERPSRRVKLMVARVDPWSAMKVGFLLSVALGIAMVVMTAVLWSLMAAMGVFDAINDLTGQIVGEGAGASFDVLDFMGFGRVVSLSVVVAVIDVFLMTALATLSAFLYNTIASLVGGLNLTLTDD